METVIKINLNLKRKFGKNLILEYSNLEKVEHDEEEEIEEEIEEEEEEEDDYEIILDSSKLTSNANNLAASSDLNK